MGNSTPNIKNMDKTIQLEQIKIRTLQHHQIAAQTQPTHAKIITAIQLKRKLN